MRLAPASGRRLLACARAHFMGNAILSGQTPPPPLSYDRWTAHHASRSTYEYLGIGRMPLGWSLYDTSSGRPEDLLSQCTVNNAHGYCPFRPLPHQRYLQHAALANKSAKGEAVFMVKLSSVGCDDAELPCSLPAVFSMGGDLPIPSCELWAHSH